ncbi:DUF3667 domain-containing protein [Flavobacterium sp. PLA-1-15]|uniref:DUF3667 domain-containing protein n=1 Tax=Flavobacterium sp. PLA-1-15 TaxID=3380533 RepID=UPI003B7AB48E
MTSNNCLNCEKELVDQYCSGCGQKADTHRITFKNFIFHDVLHGTFHLEKGILFTIKEALLRPGKASLDYIYGKRKRYYNVFYLILLTFAFLLFLRHFYAELQLALGYEIPHYADNESEANKALDNIYSQKSKLLLFLAIPFGALNSYLLFRRKKLNLSEHCIIAGMLLLGSLLFSILGHLIFYFSLIIEFSDGFANTVSQSIIFLIFFYICYGFYNAFSAAYSKWGIAYRIVLFFVMLAFEMALLLLLLIGIVSNWTFQGTYSINPMAP